jgi:ribonucleoside-diphosphate reductase alpha chain
MTKPSIRDVAEQLFRCKDRCGREAPLLEEEVYQLMQTHHEALDKAIDFRRDFNYDYFGFKTLERSYLLKVDGRIVERPQHMLMRVAVGIHRGDLASVLETYDLMSQKFFTHATPTLFNAGLPNSQMSSCFLLTMKSDSITGIYDTLAQCAKISKSAGGIGISISDIRARDSYIRGTNGTSNGIVPMLRVYNDTARYVDQGGGKRKGSFAMYLEPWHADVFEFLDLKKNTGKEENRARDLFYGLWIPDLFMRRVIQDEQWTLFCPNECPGLPDLWGEKFEELYLKYEQSGRGRRTLKARELWQAVVDSQIETGTPYMLFKDHCNRKSNQQHLGTIKSSNLCTEIVEYTAPDEVAVCNLASISLPAFLDRSNKTFDLEGLVRIARVCTRNLNKIIDLNYYPVEEARRSNLRHRPIGIGVQGLADVFQQLLISFESKEAADLNEKIFEAIYYGAVTESIELAAREGPFPSYEGSPTSKGLLQFDLWNHKPTLCGFDWEAVKARMAEVGIRNSLLVAPMPTASTSQILGNNETFEPFTANVYTRRVLAGEFVCINKNLVEYLITKVLPLAFRTSGPPKSGTNSSLRTAQCRRSAKFRARDERSSRRSGKSARRRSSIWPSGAVPSSTSPSPSTSISQSPPTPKCAPSTSTPGKRDSKPECTTSGAGQRPTPSSSPLTSKPC